MFTPMLHHHMHHHHLHHHHCHPTPFGFGAMTMMSRMNFFMGMAMATAPMPIFSMPYSFGTPFMNPFFNPTFANPTFGFLNNYSYSNPFTANNIYSNSFTPLPTPTVSNFKYSGGPYAFGSLSAGSIFNENTNQTSNNTRLSNVQNSSTKTNTALNYTGGATKIKPGLLKGNLVGKESVISQLCEKYGVDVALVVSIIGQESGFGTSNLAQHNNFMGYRAAGDLGKSSKGFGYFSTPEKGLEVAIRNLSRYPERYPSVKKADMNNIDAIGKIYCEGNTYSSAIKNIYNTTVKGYLA